MKRLSSTILILLVLLPAWGQKEVFFSSVSKDSIKVESLQGIEIGTGMSLWSLFEHKPSYDKSFSIPLNIGYFNEKRIAPNWTLIYSVGLSYTFSKMLYPVYDSLNYSYGSYDSSNVTYINSHYLRLYAGIEPRWYFTYKSRYEVGKAKLNSGWYLSFPLGASTTILNTFKLPIQIEYLSSYINYVGFGGSLNLGYRRAISKRWFLEGNVSLLGISTSLYSLNKKLNLSRPYISYPTGMSLKAVYTFK